MDKSVEYLDKVFNSEEQTMGNIQITKEGAYVATHFLNRYIKGIATTAEVVQIDKMTAFYLMQKLLPLCEWEEGEERIMVRSLEQLQTFL